MFDQQDIHLLQLLAHQPSLSTTDIADQLDLSVGEIESRLKSFEAVGLDFQRTEEGVFCLEAPLELIHSDQIEKQLNQTAISAMTAFTHCYEVDSTNKALEKYPADQRKGKVCLAEFQSAGQGRHGRNWSAAFASGLCFSVGWEFPATHPQLQLLSLLPGIAIIRALKKTEGIDTTNLGLKWPNDVLSGEKKLAGILIESQSFKSNTQNMAFVIGIGINIQHRRWMENTIGQPWLALSEIASSAVSRNALMARLLNELFPLLEQFSAGDPLQFVEEWREYDQIKNKHVALHFADHSLHGISKGIDDDGSLRLEVNGKIQTFVSGEMRLRLTE